MQLAGSLFLLKWFNNVLNLRRLGRLEYEAQMEVTRNEYNDLIVELNVKRTSEELIMKRDP
jgi:hypothetical protein